MAAPRDGKGLLPQVRTAAARLRVLLPPESSPWRCAPAPVRTRASLQRPSPAAAPRTPCATAPPGRGGRQTAGGWRRVRRRGAEGRRTGGGRRTGRQGGGEGMEEEEQGGRGGGRERQEEGGGGKEVHERKGKQDLHCCMLCLFASMPQRTQSRGEPLMMSGHHSFALWGEPSRQLPEQSVWRFLPHTLSSPHPIPSFLLRSIVPACRAGQSTSHRQSS